MWSRHQETSMLVIVHVHSGHVRTLCTSVVVRHLVSGARDRH